MSSTRSAAVKREALERTTKKKLDFTFENRITPLNRYDKTGLRPGEFEDTNGTWMQRVEWTESRKG